MTFETRPIRGFEGLYSVTSDGRVWSEPRVVTRSNGTALPVQGRWLVPIKAATGYLLVALSKGGRAQQFLLHRLVAAAWVKNPQPETRTQVNHLNGVKADNCDTNLEWCTAQQNVLHSFRELGRVHGDAVRANAKRVGTATRSLTPEQVRDARARAARGESLTSIAAFLPLSKAATHSLIHRRTYRDI